MRMRTHFLTLRDQAETTGSPHEGTARWPQGLPLFTGSKVGASAMERAVN